MTYYRFLRPPCIRKLLFACCALIAACTTDDNKLFSKLDAAETGIDFVNVNHETERSNILTYEYFYNGGGVALGDINNDGLTDVYFTSNIFANKLYLNKGNFKFEDITKTAGVTCEVGWKTGTTMVDINNDGFLDIYVCRSASPDPERRRNLLLINNKDNTFTERAKEYNLDDPSYSTQAAFFDYDRDGDVDAFLLNHSTLDISNSFLLNPKNSKTRFPNVGNRLMRNDHGRFVDMSDTLGIYGPASNYGLGVSLSDINNDGWIDIYTGCDYTGSDRMLFNQSGANFSDVSKNLSHISKFTMGTDIADLNGDGLMDLVTLDMLPEDNHRQKQLLGSDKYEAQRTMVRNGLHHQYMRNMLQLNMGDGTFSEVGQLAGISNTDWSWGALVADFDNDGAQDLFITNGFKRNLTDNDFAKFKAFEEMRDAQRKAKKVSFLSVINKFSENKLSNYMFRNTSDLNFQNVTEAWGLDQASLANGVAYGDLDNDGDLDLVVNNINDAAGIYRNNTDQQRTKNYFEVRFARGQNSLGTKVTLFAGDDKFVRENLPVRGFQSCVDPRLHFGLGIHTFIDSMIVAWPNGTSQMFTNVAANRILELSPEAGRVVHAKVAEPLMQQISSPNTFHHTENEFVDFREQALLPRMYSREGPGVAVADVNADGVDDLFFGGAKGQRAELWLGNSKGYTKSELHNFDDLVLSEVTDAAFFDADGDNDPDLYVVTGGYEFSKDDSSLQDYLFINTERGSFAKGVLPELRASGSCVRPADFDRDGDIDLFVGGRIVPGRYPESPESTLLINNGKAAFSVGESIPQELSFGGMVTDALWADVNADGDPDLITVGEWMRIQIFINQKGKLILKPDLIAQPSSGFWNCIASHDVDSDGDLDFIAGNQGMNTQMHASSMEPVTLVYDDFDKNGSVDPIVCYFIQGVSYPYATRDELTEQLPSFKKRFTSYRSYSSATLKEVLTPDEFSAAKKLTVEELQSCILLNENGKFTLKPMPREAQFSPIHALFITDISGDARPELLTGGNLSGVRSRTGKMTGNKGFVFQFDKKGDLKFMAPSVTGISIEGDVKAIIAANKKIVYAVNDGGVFTYESASKVTNSIAKK